MGSFGLNYQSFTLMVGRIKNVLFFFPNSQRYPFSSLFIRSWVQILSLARGGCSHLCGLGGLTLCLTGFSALQTNDRTYGDQWIIPKSRVIKKKQKLSQGLLHCPLMYHFSFKLCLKIKKMLIL